MKKYLISKNSTITSGIRKLNKLKIKTLIIHDKYKLLGTLMDSDIRRAFSKNLYNPKDPIYKICNKKPKFLDHKNKSSDNINKIIKLIPVLNKRGKIIRIIERDKNEKNDDKLKSCDFYLLAGGKGERMKKKTNKTPKPLLKYKKKRIIFYLLDYLMKYRFKNVFVVTCYLKNKMQKILSKKYKKIKFIKESSPLGTAGFLKLLNFRSVSENFFVSNSDIIVKIDYNSLYQYHRNNKADLTICCFTKEFNIPYGVIENINKKIFSLNEKPKLYYSVNSGIYLFNKKVLKVIKSISKSKIEINDLINFLIKKNMKVKQFPIYEKYLHFTYPEDLLNS
tara:strand:- start:517 stop:1524 length:1008 start_codon:yes stop_codon:yes gene_type:complete